MIKLIGIRRLAIIFVLFFMAAGLAGAYFLWTEPLRQETEKELKTLKTDISGFRSKILNIKEELKALRASLGDYEAMESEGFFINQDRFMVGDVLEEIRKASGVSGFEYTISALKEIENKDAKVAGYNLINSRIELNRLNAFIDNDVFQFMTWINKTFPGHTRIHMFKIDKVGEVNNELLSKIVSGEAEPIISGKLIFDWQTLSPVADKESNQPSGFGNTGFK